MTFQPKDAQKAIHAIKRGESKDGWGKQEIADVLEVMKARKDKTFDTVSVRAQLHYTGRQREIVEEALLKQFPNTKDQATGETLMPIANVNLLKMFARLDAGVLVAPPDFFLEDEKGERRPAEDEASKLWAWALRKARMRVKLSETERRALVTPGCSVGVVSYRFGPNEKVGKPHVDLYFPHDVEALCHWDAPISWDHRYVVAIRQASPDTTSTGQWYLVFYREPPATMDGEWGTWRRVLVSTEGEVAAPPEDVPGSLCPVFLVQLSDPEGHPFVLDEPDLLDAVVDILVRRSNEAYTVNLQGHDHLWTNDPEQSAKWRSGPDAVLTVEQGAQVGNITQNPKIREQRESRDQALRDLASSRGTSPHAYVQKASGNPTSGVAMMIENLAHNIRVAEQAVIMQDIIENEILPILLDVMIAHHPKGHILKGLVARMVPRMQPALEDPLQKQTRLFAAVEKKMIRRERAAADLDYYPSVEVAKTELAAIDTEKPTTPITLPPADPAAGDTPKQDEPEDEKRASPPPPPPPKAKAKAEEDEEGGTVEGDARTVTLNELTLGIERMGKLGDVDTVNILRRALAATLGVKYAGDVSAADLPSSGGAP